MMIDFTHYNARRAYVKELCVRWGYYQQHGDSGLDSFLAVIEPQWVRIKRFSEPVSVDQYLYGFLTDYFGNPRFNWTLQDLRSVVEESGVPERLVDEVVVELWQQLYTQRMACSKDIYKSSERPTATDIRELETYMKENVIDTILYSSIEYEVLAYIRSYCPLASMEEPTFRKVRRKVEDELHQTLLVKWNFRECLEDISEDFLTQYDIIV